MAEDPMPLPVKPIAMLIKKDCKEKIVKINKFQMQQTLGILNKRHYILYEIKERRQGIPQPPLNILLFPTD